MSDDAGGLTEFLGTLQGMEGLTAEDIAGLKRIVGGEAPVSLPAELETDKEQGPDDALNKRHAQLQTASLMRGHSDESDEFRDIRTKLPNLTIPEKIKLALFGNSLCRALLVLDSSRVVQQCVLKSPRLREGEVEAFAKNHNVPELVLREISKSRNWMKSYSMKFNLVTNPKTPGDLALKWLHFLVKADLRKVAVSKNLSQLVTINARKLVADMEKKRS